MGFGLLEGLLIRDLSWWALGFRIPQEFFKGFSESEQLSGAVGVRAL